MLHLVEHTLQDTAILLPVLFLTYLVMEYLEHSAGDKTQKLIQKAGLAGPAFGGVLGAVPQCGFSAAAANLYAGRVITLGTLIAIFLSTSDEMLPIMISQKVSWKVIGGILLLKALIGMAVGIVVDVILRKKGMQEEVHIHEMCEHEHCHCEQGYFRSALRHTVRIYLFVLIATFLINLLLYYIGEDSLENIILNHVVMGPLLAGAVGLIPNCAGSVVITSLYLEKAMSFGAAMAGLLASSGVGLLVLFRVNHHRKENMKVLGLVYGISVFAGILLSIILK